VAGLSPTRLFLTWREIPQAGFPGRRTAALMLRSAVLLGVIKTDGTKTIGAEGYRGPPTDDASFRHQTSVSSGSPRPLSPSPSSTGPSSVSGSRLSGHGAAGYARSSRTWTCISCRTGDKGRPPGKLSGGLSRLLPRFLSPTGSILHSFRTEAAGFPDPTPVEKSEQSYISDSLLSHFLPSPLLQNYVVRGFLLFHSSTASRENLAMGPEAVQPLQWTQWIWTYSMYLSFPVSWTISSS